MLPRAPVFLLQVGPGRVTLGEYPSVSTSSQITTRSDAGWHMSGKLDRGVSMLRLLTPHRFTQFQMHDILTINTIVCRIGTEKDLQMDRGV